MGGCRLADSAGAPPGAGSSGAASVASEADAPERARNVETTTRTLSAVRSWIVGRRRRGFPIPRRLGPEDAQNRSDLRDAWGNDVLIEPEVSADSGEVVAFSLRSAGPDGRFGNADDLVDAPAPESR